jgi:hypothetical protein
MQSRYVPVTRASIDALVAAVDQVGDGPARQAMTAIVHAYETDSVACIHSSVLRAGQGGRCADCGAWV